MRTVATISSLVKFGTSTWAYEGWQGLVYHQTYAKGRFKQECLAEYARHSYRGLPLFQTVGLDQSFYGPPTPEQLQRYAAQLPAGFEMCSKVWEEITIPRFATHPRYGKRAGQTNPHFLDAQIFLHDVLEPYRKYFVGHTGPFLFEFQRTGLAEVDFFAKLDRFFGELPTEFRYAVEVRDAGLLSPDYVNVLTKHSVAHIYNHWTWMPALSEQHARLDQRFTAPFTVLRLLTPLGMPYADAVKTAAPYQSLVRPMPTMRRDTIRIVRQAAGEDRRAYVLVNNRAEGCAPLTIQALVDALTAV
jgi:uncharacterized protein YecE (DUF72 family)